MCDRRLKQGPDLDRGGGVKAGTFKLKLEGVAQGKRFSRKLVHWVLSGMAQSAEDLR